MVHSRKALLDPQRFEELDELFVDELGSVVYDYLLGNLESANDITPNEFLYFCCGYLCELFRFCLFCEVINCHYDVVALSASCKEWPN